MNQVNHLLWQALEWPGLEYFTLRSESGGWLAAGQLVGLYEDRPYSIRYRVQLDSGWQVKEAAFWNGQEPQPFLRLFSDTNGNWYNQEKKPLPRLSGCVDVDITLTPFTNSLPIHRLSFLPDQPRSIAVAYIQLPEGKVDRAEQIYTQQAADLYRFEQPALNFTADIRVDANGFVTDYPDLFRRLY